MSFVLFYSPSSHFVHCTLVAYEGPGKRKPIGKWLATTSEWIDLKAALDGSKIPLRQDDFYAKTNAASESVAL